MSNGRLWSLNLYRIWQFPYRTAKKKVITNLSAWTSCSSGPNWALMDLGSSDKTRLFVVRRCYLEQTPQWPFVSLNVLSEWNGIPSSTKQPGHLKGPPWQFRVDWKCLHWHAIGTRRTFNSPVADVLANATAVPCVSSSDLPGMETMVPLWKNPGRAWEERCCSKAKEEPHPAVLL